MPYIQKKLFAGRVCCTFKYYTNAYHPKGQKRQAAEHPTREAQQKLNDKNRELTLWLRIEANFSHRDSHTVLHYYQGQQPEGIQQAEKDLTQTIRLTRDLCKKQGVPLRWIAVTETKGRNGDLFHHHIIVNAEAAPVLWDAWETVLEKQGRMGRSSASRMDRRDSHKELAAYLLKHSKKTAELWETLGYKRKQRWRASANLVQPTVKKKVISANQWAKEPKPSKGMRLLKNSDGNTYQTGISDVTGWPWMEYTEIRDMN